MPWGIAFLRSGAALVVRAQLGPAAARSPPTARSPRSAPSPAWRRRRAIGEGGLLGIALAPGDEDTLFAYFTSASDNRVARVSLAGGRVGRPRLLVGDIPTSTHHHGGRLLFDADGMLLVSTGDAEQSELAQDKDSLAGKILRIRPDGRAAAGNPFGNRTWSYGHRNIEGLAFDADGRLWATEFGDKDDRRAEPDPTGPQLRLAGRGGPVRRRPLHQPEGHLVTDQQLLTGRASRSPGRRPSSAPCRVSACSPCRSTGPTRASRGLLQR